MVVPFMLVCVTGDSAQGFTLLKAVPMLSLVATAAIVKDISLPF